MMHMLILPGLHDSDPEHWQSRWEARAETMHRNSPARELSPKLTPDGKYLIWMSCRVPALPAKPQRRTTTEVLQELHAPGNELGDIYQIDVSAVPALKPPQ